MIASIETEFEARLNPAQYQAVTHGEDPLLIIAGAGTGKTTTLAHRVAWLIAKGIDPGQILLLTFTRRAANEMLRRVDRILSAVGMADVGERSSIAKRIWGGTFHGTAVRLLRRFGPRIGLPADFTILDRGDAEDLMNVVRTELDLGKKFKRFPLKGTCLDIYGRTMNSQTRLKDVLTDRFPKCEKFAEGLAALFTAFVERKEQQHLLDYDDLLLFWKGLLENEEVAERIRKLFRAVLVDEFQDTNVLQSDILRGLSPEGRGLTVVGDDAQSIYSFRAAEVENILNFPDSYPGTTLVTLEQNYRSTQTVLEVSNQVMAESNGQFDKNLWSDRGEGEKPLLMTCADEDQQAEYIIGQVLDHVEQGIPLSSQAVLFRASQHSLLLEVELTRANIPFHKYGGLKFSEAAHVKDLLAFLRLAENPYDIVSGMRVLGLLPGIGPKRAQSLMNDLQHVEGDFRLWHKAKVPKATVKHWERIIDLFATLRNPAVSDASVASEVHRVREFYSPLLEEKYDRSQPRLRDLEQLEIVAGRYGTRSDFLTDMSLDPPNSTQDFAQSGEDQEDDFLVLSTVHSAKGLEWDCVYVIQVADGNFPSAMSLGSEKELAEERRLLYVALTRAKDYLYVCHPMRSYAGRRSDQYGYAQLSRFISDEVKQRFERITSEQPRPSSHKTQPTANQGGVREAAKAMWN